MTILDRFGVPGTAAIVTGAGRGLGAATAVALAEAGSDVLISARTGSYALAGSVSAAEVLAAAVSSPLHGRAYDRFG